MDTSLDLFESLWDFGKAAKRDSVNGSDDLLANLFIADGDARGEDAADENHPLPGVVFQFRLGSVDVDEFHGCFVDPVASKLPEVRA